MATSNVESRLARPMVEIHSGDTTTAPASISPRRTRVGLIGAGDRTGKIYMPLFKALEEEFEVVGFTVRTQHSAEKFASANGLTSYPDATALIERAKPDFLVAAVSSGMVDATLPGLIDLGCPLLIETPFCWSVLKGRKLLAKIEKSGLLVGVAEQTPFLPEEQLKRRLIDLGHVGRPILASNHYAVYDYHGVAALRAYFDSGCSPAATNATSHSLPGDNGYEIHELAIVEMTNHARFVHHFSPHFDNQSTGWKTLKLVGTSGSIVGTDVHLSEGADRASIERIVSDGCLQKLTCQTANEQVEWHNPFPMHPLCDEKIAVGLHLRAMAHASRRGTKPLYSARSALLDVETMTAMRLSSRRKGARINVPASMAQLVRDAVEQRARHRLGIRH